MCLRYPACPQFNLKRPNVFRGYRIISASDGKPYKGRQTKTIKLEYDYVAKISEKHPGGQALCKIWPQNVTAYQTDYGWLVSSPSGTGMEFNLKMLLNADRVRLERAFSDKEILSIKELSARINAMEDATKACSAPKGEWE